MIHISDCAFNILPNHGIQHRGSELTEKYTGDRQMTRSETVNHCRMFCGKNAKFGILHLFTLVLLLNFTNPRPVEAGIEEDLEEALRVVVNEATKAISWLENQGAAFDDEVQSTAQAIVNAAEIVNAEMQTELEKFAEEMRKLPGSVEEGFKQAAIDKAIREHGASIEEAAIKTKAIFEALGDDLQGLHDAIQSKDPDRILKKVLELAKKHPVFGDWIKKIDEDGEYGSLIIQVGAGGGAAVIGGSGSIGNAIDITSLVHLITGRGLQPNRTLISSFVSGGGAVGAVGGLSASVAIGYSTDPPSSGGPSFEISASGAINAGAGVSVSFDMGDFPQKMPFSGFSITSEGGGKVEFSAGISHTKIVTSISTDDVIGIIGKGGRISKSQKPAIDQLISYKGDPIYRYSDGSVYRKNVEGEVQRIADAGSSTNIAAGNGGVYSVYVNSGGTTIYFSRDGKNLEGLGNSEVAYRGSSRCKHLCVLPGQGIGGKDIVATVFASQESRGKDSLYISRDGRNLGGGQNTQSIKLSYDIRAIAAANNGFYISYDNYQNSLVIFYESNFSSQVDLFKGPSVESFTVLPGAGAVVNGSRHDAIIVSFNISKGGRDVFDNKENYGCSRLDHRDQVGRWYSVYPDDLYDRLLIVPDSKGGVYTSFSPDGKKTAVYYSPDGRDLGGEPKRQPNDISAVTRRLKGFPSREIYQTLLNNWEWPTRIIAASKIPYRVPSKGASMPSPSRPPAPTSKNTSSLSASAANRPRFVADFNGDGRADVCGIAQDGVFVALSDGRGQFGVPQKWLDHYMTSNNGWLPESTIRTIGDVNGDKRADLVGFGGAGVLVALSTGNSFSKPEVWLNDFGGDQGWTVKNHIREIHDVNGDGKDDIIAGSSGNIVCAISNGANFEPIQVLTRTLYTPEQLASDTDDLAFGDVTGNGKADVVYFTSDAVLVYPGTGTGIGSKIVIPYVSGWSKKRNNIRTVADVDGDGKDDIVGFGNNSVVVITQNGDRRPRTWTTNFTEPAGWVSSDLVRTLGDVNGDGKADVVGFGVSNLVVSTSSGSQFGQSTLWHGDYFSNAKWLSP